MTKYAAYNSNASQPVPVASWYDSESTNYIDFTQPGFIEVSDQQWAARNEKIWTVSGSEIVEYIPPPQNLSVVQQRQLNILIRACASQIISGFASSALGVAYTYASDAVSQRNILLAAQSTKGGLLSCQDASGVWSRQPHTQAQAQQVLEDFVGICDAARAKLTSKETGAASAKTVETVQAVVWGA